MNINELRVVNDELGIGVLTERKVSEVELLGLAVQLLKDRFEVEEATKFMPITIREPGRYLVVPLNLLEDES